MKQAFKQALMLMRQHKLYSSIYVAGTALSITLTMVILVILYVKFGPIYPEQNRADMMIIKKLVLQKKDSANGPTGAFGGVAESFARLLQENVKNAEAFGVKKEVWSNTKLTLPDGSQKAVKALRCNADWWKVFTYKFVAGRPFNDEESEADLPVAVLSTTTAKLLFATTDAVDKKFMFRNKELRVVGVYEPCSAATPDSFADLFLPLPVKSAVLPTSGQYGGSSHIFMLPKNGNKQALKQEVEEVLAKINALNEEEWDHDLMGQPDTHAESVLRTSTIERPNVTGEILKYALVLLALLFIPALNLSGMMSSRMDERQEEMGVRRAFGATRRQLIGYVLNENLVLTALGGLIGLLLAAFTVWMCIDWILYLFDWEGCNHEATDVVNFDLSMVFNPVLLIGIVLFVLLLNLISALIPTVWALRKSIVWSLNNKKA